MNRTLAVSIVAVVAVVATLALAGCPPDDDGNLVPVPLTEGARVVAGVAGHGIADGKGGNARFDSPTGIAVTPDERTAYVAEAFVGTIRQLDLETGDATTVLGQPFVLTAIDGVGTDAFFFEPRGLDVSPDGSTLWVGDGPSLRRVDLVTMEVTTVAGNPLSASDVDDIGPAARFGGLLHDVEDDGSFVYVVDRSNDKIRAVDVDTFAVTTLAIGFDNPGGVAREESTLFVADTFNASLKSIDLTQGPVDAPVTVVSTDVGQAQGVEVVDGALFTLGFDAALNEVDRGTGEVSAIIRGSPAEPTADGAAGVANISGAFASLVARGGDVLFADLSSGAMRTIAVANGTVTTLAGPIDTFGYADGDGAQARFTIPFIVEGKGNGESGAFVADLLNHAIRVVDVDIDAASVSTLTGGDEGYADGSLAEARFSFPVGLAHDAAANVLYVGEQGNQRVRVVDLGAGSVSTLAGNGGNDGVDGDASSAQFADPWEIELDVARGKLYVADASGPTVRSVDVVTGDVETIAGALGEVGYVDGGLGVSRFRAPHGLALARDTLFVSDFDSHTLRALDLDTLEVTTVVGADGFEGFADGAGADSLLSFPAGLDVDVDGRALLMAESGNHIIRRVSLDDFSTRVALGRPGFAAGMPPVAFALEDSTVNAPEDVAVVRVDAGTFSSLELFVTTEHAVVRAVSEVVPK